MVIRLLVVCLVFLAAVVFAFGTAMVILDYEEKKQKSEEEKAEETFQLAITMCLKTRHANQCPGVCEKCAWGVMKNKIVEFREKK